MHNIFTDPTKTSSICLAILVFILYTLMKDEDMPMVFMGCVCVHLVVMIAFVMIHEICCTRRPRVRTNSTSVNHLIGCGALHHYVPSSEAFPTRRRLQELRLQVSLLDRELDEFENLTVRELPSANVSGIPSMSEEEINALPVHNYKGADLERYQFLEGSTCSVDAAPERTSSSSASAKEFVKIGTTDVDCPCDELTCNICLEQVVKGDLVRSLPCLHQFHCRCIDPWLGLNASCPICKIMLGSGVQRSMDSEISSDDEMV